MKDKSFLDFSKYSQKHLPWFRIINSISIVLFLFSADAANGQISFTQHVVADQYDGACSVHATDIDVDGDVDILGCAFFGDELTLWYNQGDSLNPWNKTIIENQFDGAHFVNTGDFDCDGDSDIVAVAQLANEVSWWRNDGGYPIVWTKFLIDGSYMGAQQVFPFDMDDDGDQDLVCTAYIINDVSWYRNEGGNPIIWSKQLISSNAIGSVSVCVADIDNDDDYDVLTADYTAGRISWWRNDSISEYWSHVIIDNNFYGAHEVRTGDIDNDGDKDIIGAAYSLDDIKWWRNDGGTPVQWTELMINGSFDGASSVSCADLDDDGDIDVLGAAHNAGDFAWWSNEGGQPVTWTKHTIENNFAEAWPIIAYDIDLDTDLDVLVGGRAIDRISWFENLTITSIDKSITPFSPILYQNFPNPFNPETIISYQLSEFSNVELTIYNSLGKEIKTLLSTQQSAGRYSIDWYGKDNFDNPVSSGAYYYQLRIDKDIICKKMILVR